MPGDFVPPEVRERMTGWLKNKNKIFVQCHRAAQFGLCCHINNNTVYLQWAAVPEQKNSMYTLRHISPGTDNTRSLSEKAWYLIGRSESMGVDIRIDDPSVSQRHAVLVHHKDGGLFLIDLASRTGCELDGHRIPTNKPTLVASTTTATSVLRIGPNEYHITRHNTSNDGNNNKVRASHVLVKHCKSRRPSSWKEETITRSPEDALEMIERFREKIVSGECTFEGLARVESDCSSAKRGGDLGWFGRREMQKEFEDATYALNVNELSQPVFSQSGVHLILRTG